MIFEAFEAIEMSKADPTMPETYVNTGKLSRDRLFDALVKS